MIGSLARNIASQIVGGKGFVGGKHEDNNNLLVHLVAIVIIIVIMLFIGRYIWNNVLVQVVPGVKSIENSVDLLLLMFLSNMLFCC